MANNYESPTIESVGGGEAGQMATLAAAFYFVAAAVSHLAVAVTNTVVSVAAIFNVAAFWNVTKPDDPAIETEG